MQTPDHLIIDAMRQYGGSFVRALAETAACADCTNLRRLKDAFPDYWRKYAEMTDISTTTTEPRTHDKTNKAQRP